MSYVNLDNPECPFCQSKGAIQPNGRTVHFECGFRTKVHWPLPDRFPWACYERRTTAWLEAQIKVLQEANADSKLVDALQSLNTEYFLHKPEEA